MSLSMDDVVGGVVTEVSSYKLGTMCCWEMVTDKGTFYMKSSQGVCECGGDIWWDTGYKMPIEKGSQDI